MAAKDVQAVAIASPTFLHADMAVAALEAGKHVICEKPLGRTAREAAAMARAAQASGRVAMTGFNDVKNPATQLARQIVAGGEIGEVIHFAVHAAAVVDAVLASCDAGAWVRVDRIEAEARA